MSKPGRNDPCPCGSGKKFKKCCLARGPEAWGAYSPAERDSALALLGEFTWRPEMAPQRDAAEEVFWAPLHRMPQVDTDDPELIEESAGVFEDWFAFDVAGAEGRSPLEALLEREGHRLSAGEREFLERLGRTELRLYEVTDPAPGIGVGLVDLWADAWRFMHDPEAAKGLRATDVLAARLMPGPAGGGVVIEGATLPYPTAAKEDVLSLLRGAVPPHGGELPLAGTSQLRFKSAVPVLHCLWMVAVAGPSAPRILPERDALIWTPGGGRVISSVIIPGSGEVIEP